MKIIITGAAGGIGSLLSEYLTGFGHQLILIDNFSSGNRANFVNKNLADEIYKYDLSELNVFENIFENADYIIHLAATSSLPECQNDLLSCFNNNVNNTISILEIARKYYCKVIFASTSAVYENNYEKILTEDLPVKPTLNYSMSKLTCEILLNSYASNYNVQSVALRFFNVFGPNQNANRKHPPLINYIIREMAAGNMPTIFSDLNQSRDYVTVQDVVQSIDTILRNEWKSSFEVYNICSGNLVSIKEIIGSIEKSIGQEIKLNKGSPIDYWKDYNNIFSKKSPFNPKLVEKELSKTPLGSNSKLYEHFGWKPKQSVLENIALRSNEIFLKYVKNGN
jgi:UDP-glucose 4-epimerase